MSISFITIKIEQRTKQRTHKAGQGNAHNKEQRTKSYFIYHMFLYKAHGKARIDLYFVT